MSLSIPAWVLASQRWGKKKPLVAGIALLGITGAVVYPWYPPGAILPVLIGSSILGGLLVGSVVLLDSWLADIVDYDTLRSRGQRFGLYFGLWKTGGKASRAVAVGVGGLCLRWAGVHAGVTLAPEATGRLAWLFGVGVGAFFVTGAVIASAVGLDEQAHRRVRALLARRTARQLHKN
jgi:GPH family glycoside/pentoside/hexuronide:cation symporter